MFGQKNHSRYGGEGGSAIEAIGETQPESDDEYTPLTSGKPRTTNEMDSVSSAINYKSIGRSQKSYTMVIKRRPDGIVPAYRGVFLVANAALGAGLLNFPQSFYKSGGLINGLSIQLVFLVFIIGAFLILARCADKSQATTYQDIVLYMCGKRAKLATQLLIILYFFGSCITYMIIIGTQMSKVLRLSLKLDEKENPWYVDRRFLMTVISTTFILPLCIPRRLKALSYSSFLGGTGAFFITFVIMYNYFSGEYDPSKARQPDPDVPWTRTFAAIPVICFGYQCHVSSMAVYADMKNRTMGRFFGVTVAAMFVCTTAYALSGAFGYMTFLGDTKSDILLNYKETDILANIARIMVILIIFSSFAIITFCARTCLDGIIISWLKLDPIVAEQRERCRRLIETFAWFGLALLLAAVIPDIGKAIALIGGLAALFIFVFPGLCLLNSVKMDKAVITFKDVCLLALGALYLGIGFFIFGENTTLAIYQDVDPRFLV